MSKDRDTKSPHSILARLGNHRMPGQSVQNAQTLFVLERFLARVAQSQYRDQLILKGGILLYLLTQQWVRPTEDLDLLAIRIPGESLDAVLTEILGMDLGDRLEFQAHLMTSEEYRAGMTGRADSVIDLNASALKPVFGTDPALKRIWTSYVSVRNLVTPPYKEVVSEMQAFIRPMIQRSQAPGIDASWSPLKRAWD